MTSTPNPKHQKHANIPRTSVGNFGRNELAILGASCKDVQLLIQQLIQKLSGYYKIAYVDADHKVLSPKAASDLICNASLEFTDQITSCKFIYQKEFNSFEQKVLFADYDLVLVNGNHFYAQYQILVIDERKPLLNKIDSLTNVVLILSGEKQSAIPDYISEYNAVPADVPILRVDQIAEISQFIQQWLMSRIPQLRGLILAGGKSVRMRQDKGSINYFGQTQRKHVYHILDKICDKSYISYANENVATQGEWLPYITDKFLGLGPLGGILSAFQQQPDSAWLTVACDLPYLTAETLQFLIENRDPSKMATAFLDPEGKFPEPLITIWEPRAYGRLLQFLSLGYSCPRKALINSDIKLLSAPSIQDLKNVNLPDERDEAMLWASQTINTAANN